MATMHIKNKFTVSLRELIKNTQATGGDPKHIIVDPQEAWTILKEMRLYGKIQSAFDLSSPTIHPASVIWNGSGEIDKDAATKLINQWMRGEVGISIDGIPIHVQLKKANVVAKPSGVPRPWYKRLIRT